MMKDFDTEIIRSNTEAELDIKIAEWKSKNPDKILVSTFKKSFFELDRNIIEGTITFMLKDKIDTVSNERYIKQYNYKEEPDSDDDDINSGWPSELSPEPVYSITTKSPHSNVYHENFLNKDDYLYDLNNYNKALNKPETYNEFKDLDLKNILIIHEPKLENSIDENKEQFNFLTF